MFLGGFEAMAATAKKNVTPQEIWDEVQLIPEGHVTSYGEIARRAGADLFQVRAALKTARAKAKEAVFKELTTALIKAAARGEVTPWWRVINKNGFISAGPQQDEQSNLLVGEKWELKREPKKSPVRKGK